MQNVILKWHISQFAENVKNLKNQIRGKYPQTQKIKNWVSRYSNNSYSIAGTKFGKTPIFRIFPGRILRFSNLLNYEFYM